jgi:lipopolysaccharide export LptBFGC system permease protein LptF
LLPIVAVGLFAGLLGGYASETWVPEAERARQQRVASAQGQPLTEKDALWLRVDDVVFAVRRDEAVYSVRALRWSSDAVENVWEAEGLRWTGGRWLAEVERRQGQPGDAPWISLPPPETLEAFQRVERWAGWRWSQLVEEGSPGARTERGMRVARVLACALAGVVGLTVVLVVGLSTGAVFWAVVPVAGIEGLSLACQSAAAQGVLAPALPGVLRLGLLVGVLAWAVRRLQRPIGYSTLR